MKHLEAFLKRNRELAEAAEGGEWYVAEVDEYPFHEPRQKVRYRTKFVDGAICEAFGGTGPRPKDAQFIAASRTSLPLALEMLSMTVEWITARRDAAFANMEGTDGTEFQQWSELWGISENILAALEEKAGRG